MRDEGRESITEDSIESIEQASDTGRYGPSGPVLAAKMAELDLRLEPHLVVEWNPHLTRLQHAQFSASLSSFPKHFPHHRFTDPTATEVLIDPDYVGGRYHIDYAKHPTGYWLVINPSHEVLQIVVIED